MENQMTYAEYLEHHGVKGMRWGIRRNPKQIDYKKKKSRSSKKSIKNKLLSPTMKLKTIYNKYQIRQFEKYRKQANKQLERRNKMKASHPVAEKVLGFIGWYNVTPNMVNKMNSLANQMSRQSIMDFNNQMQINNMIQFNQQMQSFMDQNQMLINQFTFSPSEMF